MASEASSRPLVGAEAAGPGCPGGTWNAHKRHSGSRPGTRTGRPTDIREECSAYARSTSLRLLCDNKPGPGPATEPAGQGKSNQDSGAMDSDSAGPGLAAGRRLPRPFPLPPAPHRRIPRRPAAPRGQGLSRLGHGPPWSPTGRR